MVNMASLNNDVREERTEKLCPFNIAYDFADGDNNKKRNFGTNLIYTKILVVVNFHFD